MLVMYLVLVLGIKAPVLRDLGDKARRRDRRACGRGRKPYGSTGAQEGQAMWIGGLLKGRSTLARQPGRGIPPRPGWPRSRSPEGRRAHAHQHGVEVRARRDCTSQRPFRAAPRCAPDPVLASCDDLPSCEPDLVQIIPDDLVDRAGVEGAAVLALDPLGIEALGDLVVGAPVAAPGQYPRARIYKPLAPN